ncbi:MAG: hypothetical protein IJ498_01400 [Akkermansia sp.]|nr:hypothetical protein [Akkermansia sp.]
MNKVRTDLIERGNILESIYSRHLPWIGYYMIAYRATAMRQFPLMYDYEDTYCITELFDGDPDAGADSLSTVTESWSAESAPAIAFNFGSGEQRPLGPQPIFPLQAGLPRFADAWVWPEKLMHMLLQFPASGLHTPIPVKSHAFGEGEYTAEGQWYLLPPPLEKLANRVDNQVVVLTIGWERDQRRWPLLLDDSHTLDTACDVIQYCGLSEGYRPDVQFPHNYLFLSERVVDALLAEAPWLVFHPICIASGTAYRNMEPAQYRLFSLDKFSDSDSEYNEFAEWRHAHLAEYIEEDEEYPQLSETDSQNLAALLESLRPACV